MKRSTHRVLGMFSLSLLAAACGGAPDGASPSGELAQAPTTSQESPSAQADAGSAAHRPAPKPRDLGPFDLINDAKEIYGDYTTILTVMGANASNFNAEVLAGLAQLEGQMTGLSSQLQTLESQIANLYAAEQQAYILQTEQQVAEQLGLATTAIEEANEWVQSGQTGPQIADALNNSLQAMNTLSNQSFWYRPGLTAGSANIFDPRLALNAYLAALTARTGVLAIYDPGFGSNSEYQAEFSTQLTWLNQLVTLMNDNMTCYSSNGVDPGPTSWGICDYCTDVASGYQSFLDGMTPEPYTPSCSNDGFTGTQSAAQTDLAFVDFYNRFRVADVMGLHVVQAFIPSIEADTVTLPHIGGIGGVHVINRTPYGPGTWNNPGVLNQGFLCLTALTSGLTMKSCAGAADQTWTTPTYGAGYGTVSSAAGTPENTITPANGSCIEMSGWQATSFAYDDACSGSPGENWQVQADGHIVWNRNTGYCLVNPGGPGLGVTLAPCADTPDQIWSRAVPYIVIDPIPVPDRFTSVSELPETGKARTGTPDSLREPGVSPHLRSRLTSHLSACLSSVRVCCPEPGPVGRPSSPWRPKRTTPSENRPPAREELAPAAFAR